MNTTQEDLEYETIHTHAVLTHYGWVGLKVLAAFPNELTQDDNRVVRKSAEDIIAQLNYSLMVASPNHKEDRALERKQLLMCFGKEMIYAKELPNGYCNQWCCKDKPWFNVTTKRGDIVIGWRKRVIQIDWSHSEIKAPAAALFPAEDTSKGPQWIHAWSYEKADAYITTLLAHSV